MKRRLLCLLLSIGCTFIVQAGEGVDCAQVFAVGDLHGAYDPFVGILQEVGLIDSELRWQGGQNCLVQLGDVVDRGARSREILDLLMDLEQQAPDRVIALLGNHEVMNLMGDLRYVDPGEFAAFAGDETPELRSAGLTAFMRSDRASGLSRDEAVARFDALFPPGWFGHRKAFAPDGRYGAWLLGHDALVILGGTLFAHGGISPDDARIGIDRLNEVVRRDLRSHHELRAKMIEAGWISPLDSLGDARDTAIDLLARSQPSDPRMRHVRSFLGTVEHILTRPDGPLWDRSLADGDEQETAGAVDSIVEALDIDRIVVAHTTGSVVRNRFDDRVFIIDTGAGPAYGGQVSALAIGGGRVSVSYPGISQLLWDLLASDRGLERVLGEGEVVAVTEIGTGSTKPLRVELELDGREVSAAFKMVDIQRPGLPTDRKRLPRGVFADSYRYERAAYLMDRALGMRMVPVVVLREIRGDPGALVEWIFDSFSEKDRREQDLQPDDTDRWYDEHATMRLFDALIANTDRNAGNQLYSRSDWKLHLIDHGRSFILEKDLPRPFLEETVRLTREMLSRLAALDLAGLRKTFGDILTRSELRAVLARRDKILDKIAADRAEHGDARVFIE